jgi:hypothetical protein
MGVIELIRGLIAFVIVTMVGSAILNELISDEDKFIKETQKIAVSSLIVTLIIIGVIKLISMCM